MCTVNNVLHNVQVEELDMLARLKLAREVEEDSMDNLVDAGEEEEEEDEGDTESLSRYSLV